MRKYYSAQTAQITSIVSYLIKPKLAPLIISSAPSCASAPPVNDVLVLHTKTRNPFLLKNAK
jgi:hypothetical protein